MIKIKKYFSETQAKIKNSILVVDDSKMILTIISATLVEVGYRVSCAENGKDALQKIVAAYNTTEQFDLLITDIEMPEMTGLELIDELQRLDFNIPVMAITTTDNKEIIIDLLRKGCSEYIPKPFEPEDLIQRTKKILEQKAHQASKKELEIKNKIDQVFIAHALESLEVQLEKFLTLLSDFMKSDFAVFRFRDPDDNAIDLNLISFSQAAGDKKITDDDKQTIDNEKQSVDMDILHELGKRSLERLSILINNNPEEPFESLMVQPRFIAVPVPLKGNDCYIVISGGKIGYTNENISILKSIINHITPVLDIKFQMQKSESQRRTAQKHLEQSNEELLKLNEELQHSQEMAQSIFGNILSSMTAGSDNIHLYLKPMEKVGGDIFLSTPIFDDRQYLILGDFTGHGLAAAIGAVPVLEIFDSIKNNSLSIGRVAREINKELKRLLPTGLFMCACLMEIDYSAHLIHIWLGGLPELLVVDKNKKLKQRLPSRHIPMAIFGDESFDQTLDVVSLEMDDSIYVFSDGITEAENCGGEMFGQERLEDAILNCGVNENVIEQVIKHLNVFCGDAKQSDDITIAEILYQKPEKKQIKDEKMTEWKISWEIGVELLKQAVPPYSDLLTLCIEPYEELKESKEELFIILAELFTNAFEHGVLALDAGLKKDVTTMPRYFEEREKAIANLEAGWINIDIEMVKQGSKSELIFEFTDCGSGFDYHQKNLEPSQLSHLGSSNSESSNLESSNLELLNNIAPSGRGISLLKSICDEITYYERGNRVRAVYSWEKSDA